MRVFSNEAGTLGRHERREAVAIEGSGSRHRCRMAPLNVVRRAHPGGRDDALVPQFGRRTYPQTRHWATPVVGSTSRKLAQPFVRQYGRVVEAADARRRRRFMALARPVTDDVVERDIMVRVLLCFLARREWRDGPSAARPVYAPRTHTDRSGSWLVRGRTLGSAHVCALDRDRPCGPVT
jgi:hypothetical protein